ncbi:hypothetical protein J4471_02915 [Candidatus Woesearchaeota archaeon]|nr:hypothetical protein [Candidatus Woesearchaeota archaeon]
MPPIDRLAKLQKPSFELDRETQKVINSLVKQLKKAYPKTVSIGVDSSDWRHIIITYEKGGRYDRSRFVYNVNVRHVRQSEKSIKIHCSISLSDNHNVSVADWIELFTNSVEDITKKFTSMILAFTDKY